MAGIITDVSSDIKKLQQLKTEIENVKKALKSINIKVDVDIAKNLETQLKSLMGQYDALVRKVGEAEGKIMLSTQRINQASEKIIKAQEQLSKGIGSPIQNTGSSNFTVNQTESAGVQAQAKAYDELEKEINNVIGTREENIKRMVDEQNAIRLINKEIKEITKTGDLSSGQRKRLEQLNNTLLTHKATLSEVRQTLMNNIKMDNAAATSMNGLSQSLSRMRIAYRDLTEEERNSPFGKELLASINQADAKIKQLDATIGNHQRNVGNYAGSWNGLNASVQQIIRELPSATMGLNMFFLAISNNLPILTDELKRAKEANDALRASGQKGVPVWKQLTSSIFSWQSALMVGITLLTVYGKDIANWVKGLFNAEKQINATVEAQKKLNDAYLKGSQNAQEELVKLNLLRKTAEDKAKTDNERNRAVEELQRLYPGYLGNLEREKILTGEVSDVYKTLSEDLLQAARAKAAFDTAVESSKEEEKLRNQFNSLVAENGDVWTKFGEKGNSIEGLRTILDQLKRERENLPLLPKTGVKLWSSVFGVGYEDEIQEIINAYDAWQAKAKETEEIIKRVDITDTTKIGDKNDEAKKQQQELENLKQEADARRQEEEQLAADLLSLRRKNQQDEINLMEEGTEKKIAQINLDYEKERDAIKKQAEKWAQGQGGTLTTEQTILISASYSNAKSKKEQDTVVEYKKQLDNLLNEYKSYDSKRREIEKKYSKDLKSLEQQRTPQNSLQIDEAVNELEYQRNETLAEIDLEFAQRSESFNSWMDAIATYSLEKLNETLRAAQAQLGTMEISGIDGNRLAEARAKVALLTKEIGKLQNKGKRTNVSPEKGSNRNWQELYDTLSNVNRQFLELGDSVGGTAGEIISASGSIATSLMQMTDSIITLASEGMQAVTGASQASASAIKTVETASVVLAVISAALQIALKIAGLFSKESTYEKYQEAKEVYENYISVLDRTIEKQLELADALSGMNASKAYDTAKETLKLQEEAARTLGKDYLNSAKKRSHTFGYKEVEEMTDQGWRQAAEAIGVSVDAFKNLMGGRMTGIFDLSVEQLERLQQDAPLFFAELDEDTRNYLNQIIDGGEKLDEIIEREKENLTTISFDSLVDDFVGALSDIESSTEDMAADMEQLFRDAIIKSFVYGDDFQKALNGWYDDFAKSMKDGSLDENEKNNLQARYDNLVKWGINYRDSVFEAMGLNKLPDEDEIDSQSQSQASSRGFGSEMTHEDAGELSGRFAAVAESNYRIESATQQQTLAITEIKGSIAGLALVSTGIHNIADETRTILANSYLELQEIKENTGNSAKYLKDIKADIAVVKQNTSKL